MAGSRNYLKRRKEKEACLSKIKYFDEEEAKTAARKLRNAKGVPARAYRCPGLYGEPRHFHITSGKKF